MVGLSYNFLMIRAIPLKNGEVYHVLNKSIAGFKIFNTEADYTRMKRMLSFFNLISPPAKFSQFLKSKFVEKVGFEDSLQKIQSDPGKKKYVQIVAYCLMPTHIHLILKQLEEGGISTYMGNLSNSYARYFNLKHKRKGPLWESRFLNVSVNSDEQLTHLTRYIHLNPVTAGIVKQPENWSSSSYLEYLEDVDDSHRLTDLTGLLKISPNVYKKFVLNQVAYQRELALIKKIILE